MPPKKSSRAKRGKDPNSSGAKAKIGGSPLLLAGSLLLLGVIGVLIFVAMKQPRTSKVENLPSTNQPALTKQVAATNENPEAMPDKSPDEIAVELINEGTALLNDGKVKEAISCYREAIKLKPDDEDGHYNLAFALAKDGKLDEARAEYLKALEIFPDYSEAHNNLGNLLVSQGKLEEALEHLRTAVQLAPTNASNRNNLGTALARYGKIPEAITEFSEATQLLPDYVEAHCNLGNAYLIHGRVADAIKEFSIALQLSPTFEPAKKGMAKARQKAKP